MPIARTKSFCSSGFVDSKKRKPGTGTSIRRSNVRGERVRSLTFPSSAKMRDVTESGRFAESNAASILPKRIASSARYTSPGTT